MHRRTFNTLGWDTTIYGVLSDSDVWKFWPKSITKQHMNCSQDYDSFLDAVEENTVYELLKLTPVKTPSEETAIGGGEQASDVSDKLFLDNIHLMWS